MNLVRMVRIGCYPRKRYGNAKGENYSYVEWGDGFWDGIGYWRLCNRKGSQL